MTCFGFNLIRVPLDVFDLAIVIFTRLLLTYILSFRILSSSLSVFMVFFLLIFIKLHLFLPNVPKHAQAFLLALTNFTSLLAAG